MIPSRFFLCLCLSFIFGIFLNSFFVFSSEKILEIFVLLSGGTLFGLFWRKKKLVFVFLILIFVVLGIFRSQLAESKIYQNTLKSYNNLEKEVVLIGTISKEPNVENNRSKLEVSIQDLIVETKKISVSGKVLITVNRWPKYKYGDKLKIIGKLQTPPNTENFSWRGHLAKEGIYSVLYWPKIELLEEGNCTSIIDRTYQKVLEFKHRLRKSIYCCLLPPQSSILGAVILGDKSRIPRDFKEKLNIAGVRHITAISGMHIAILSTVLMQFLIGVGFWRNQAFCLTILLLALFIVMVGLPSSAVRAGIMVGFFLLAQIIGRKNSAFQAVVFAAVIILATNPLLLRFDIGFQLSFLAVTGIIYLSPLFKSWLKFVPAKKLINLRSILAMTLSAQIFTLPILIYNFGTVSLVAPLTNILILPFIPFIIGWGFLFALIGVFLPLLGQALSFPCWLVLTYIVGVINWFSQLPFSSISFKDVSWVWLAICYLFLFSILVVYRQKTKKLLLKY